MAVFPIPLWKSSQNRCSKATTEVTQHGAGKRCSDCPGASLDCLPHLMLMFLVEWAWCSSLSEHLKICKESVFLSINQLNSATDFTDCPITIEKPEYSVLFSKTSQDKHFLPNKKIWVVKWTFSWSLNKEIYFAQFQPIYYTQVTSSFLTLVCIYVYTYTYLCSYPVWWKYSSNQ